MSNDLFAVKELIQYNTKFVIVSHQSPDGDAIGSSTGLYRILSNLNKTVSIVLPDRPSSVLEPFLEGSDFHFYHENPADCETLLENAEVLFALDFNTSSRVGDSLKPTLDSFKGKKVMIDHHQNPDSFAYVLISDTENTSTCQLVYETIERMELLHAFDVKAAKSIYLGMMTDTGSFRYPSVTSNTHRILTKLLELGVRPFEIHESVFDHNRIDQLQLRGYAISQKLELSDSFPFAFITLSEEELGRFNYQPGDTEGLVNVILSIEGIQVGVLVSEKGGDIKMSFRSKNHYFVNEYAQRYFNGGGHKYAAGGRTKLTLEETVVLLRSTYHEIFKS